MTGSPAVRVRIASAAAPATMSTPTRRRRRATSPTAASPDPAAASAPTVAVALVPSREARSTALTATAKANWCHGQAWVGQPDRRHQIALGEHGQDPRVDLVGLARQRRQTLDLVRVGDQHLPAALLERVVHPPPPVHRLDH